VATLPAVLPAARGQPKVADTAVAVPPGTSRLLPLAVHDVRIVWPYPGGPSSLPGGCYDGRGVRFPFTLMGILSLVFGIWIMVYFMVRGPDGSVSGGIEVAMAVVMIGFGSWVVWRRVTGREES
jgi:hypothetical protein